MHLIVGVLAELIDVQPIKNAGLKVVVDDMWGNGAGWLTEILGGGQTEIMEVHAVTGDGSHLLKVRTWNTSTLEQLLSEIQSWKGVKQTRTNVVLSSPKETSALPIEELKT